MCDTIKIKTAVRSGHVVARDERHQHPNFVNLDKKPPPASAPSGA